MSPAERDEIIDERLAYYRRRLIQAHATPMTCIGVGHDHNSGALIVCITEDLPLLQLLVFMKGAVAKVEEAIAGGQS
jgi:hypothetical protein